MAQANTVYDSGASASSAARTRAGVQVGPVDRTGLDEVAAEPEDEHRAEHDRADAGRAAGAPLLPCA